MFSKFINNSSKIFFLILIIISFQAACKKTAQNNSQTTTAPISYSEVPRASYSDVVDKVARSVVRITADVRVEQTQPPFPFQTPQQPQRQRGIGSGVIVNADGTILTNNHVVEGAEKIRIELTDKRTFTAKFVGTDKASDLAVLKIEGKDLPVAVLGNSDTVRVGDVVLAIGNPLGLGQTVTAGIISAKERATGLGDGSFEDFLQTDAPINQGNSGGALVNTNGEVIGINSQILSRSGGNIGIGFAIPSNMARSIMEQLIKNGRVSRGRLGAGIQPVTSEIAESLGMKEARGVLVNTVEAGSAADKAGIKRGDVIIALNGERVDDNNVLRNKIAATKPGTEVTLTIIRDGSEKEVKAILGEWSDNQQAGNQRDSQGDGNTSGKLGIAVEPVTPEIAKQLNLPPTTQGLVVTEVDPDGPAAEAGLQEGDIIIEINRQPAKTTDDLQTGLDKAKGKSSLLLINRRGQTAYLTVTPRG